MKYNFNCPVCDEFFFSKPLPEDNNSINRCYICGWVLNEEEMKNKEKLNKYKKIFIDNRKNNPEWTWIEANAPDPIPHMCPVCGKYEFPDYNSFDICSYCGWEDDNVQLNDPNYSGGANNLSLKDYKKQYEQKVKNNPKYKWDKEKISNL